VDKAEEAETEDKEEWVGDMLAMELGYNLVWIKVETEELDNNIKLWMMIMNSIRIRTVIYLNLGIQGRM
jgi:hypothetical protein